MDRIAGALDKIHQEVRRQESDPSRIDFLGSRFDLLFDGFYDLEERPEGPLRWMSQHARARLQVSAGYLNAEVAGILGPNRLTVLVDGNPVDSYDIHREWTLLRIDLADFRGRQVLLELKTAVVTVPAATGLSQDCRRLGIAFRRLFLGADLESTPYVPLPAEPGLPRACRPPWSRRLLNHLCAEWRSIAIHRRPASKGPADGGSVALAGGGCLMAVQSMGPGDAITGDLLGMRQALLNAGYETAVFTGQCHPDLHDITVDREAAQELLNAPGTLLIYHHGFHWHEGIELFESARCEARILRYHNVTPPDYFTRSHPAFFEGAIKGRQDTLWLVHRCTDFMVPSLANGRHILAAGGDHKRIHYVPCFHRIEELTRTIPDPETSQLLQEDKRFKVLFVGRMAPSKGVQHLVEVAALYRRRYGDGLAWHAVGPVDPRLQGYFNELRSRVSRRNLEDCFTFHDAANPPRLTAFLTHSDALISMSEIEGFCLPIIEAQSFGKPVIAYERGGKAEVAGAEQMLFASLDYRLYVEALRTMQGDPALYRDLSRKARENAHRFDIAKVRAQFLGSVRDLWSPPGGGLSHEVTEPALVRREGSGGGR